MSIEVVIHPDAVEEINEQVVEYAERFSEGGTDFLLAIEDTISRIESLPDASPPRSELNPNIRGYQVKNTQKGLARARKFPFVLIYHVEETKPKATIYQLWASRSDRQIRNIPKE